MRRVHNLCVVPTRVTPSRFKLQHRQIIRFTSVRFAQYLVKRSTADKRRDALTARLQSAPIIRRCYVDGRRHGLEREKTDVGRRRKSCESDDVFVRSIHGNNLRRLRNFANVLSSKKHNHHLMASTVPRICQYSCTGRSIDID